MITAIINGKIVTPKGVKKGSILIDSGKISKIVPFRLKADYIEDVKGSYVLPGFFDTHLHGGGGYDSSNALFNVKRNAFAREEENYAQGVETILREHARHGTTSMILSTGTNSEENISKYMKYAGYFVKEYSGGAKLLGADIEGVFIKDPAYAGAQSLKYLQEPDIRLFDRFMKISGGTIKRVLVAPEWGDSAIKLIKHLVKNGVVPGVGHSGATYDQFMRAYDAGVKVLIHFGNGPMSQNFKGGGILDAAFFLKDKIYAEIVCDYYHVNPRWVAAFLKNFNSRAIGVTDAMFPVGCAGYIKEFEMGGKICAVEKDILKLKGSANTLFGSMLTTDKAFQNFLNIYMKNITGYLTGPLFEKPVTLEKALMKTSKLLSLNPARLYGFDKEIGTLEKGKSADIVVMDIKKLGADYKCSVKKVFVNGEKVD
ncbi:MAG: amidohydrolase family protein [Candidatus Firestonebacteria bacterium]